MSNDDKGEFEGGRLFELYTKYVTEPESKRDVYGYTVLIIGYLLGMAGMVVFLVGPSGGGLDPMTILVREIAIPAAGLGLVVTLMGIVLMLPVKRRGVLLGGLGTAMGLVAAIWFVVAYPENWSVGTPDYSSSIITLYTIGIALVAGVVVMVPVITGERSYFAAAREVLGQEHPDIMLGRTDRGGLFTVFNRGSDWTWRLIDQSAVAASTSGFLSRLETEDRVERVKETVEEAALFEITHAAFRLYQAGEDRWRWLLMRENGSVVADSGDEYPSRETAEASVNDLKEFGPEAAVIAIDEAAFETYPENGHWRWRLVDDRRRPMADGPGEYPSRQAASEAADTFARLATEAPQLTIETAGIELVQTDEEWQWHLLDGDLESVASGTRTFENKGGVEDAAYDLLERLGSTERIVGTQPSYDVYEPSDGSWRWRLMTPEGRSVARGLDSKGSSDAVVSDVRTFKRVAPSGNIIEISDEDFEVYRDSDRWHWRLVDGDRTVRARSAEDYADEAAAEAAIDRLRRQAPDADLIEFEKAAFQIYESDDGGWRWRLIDEDGNVLADSSEGEYDSRDGATAAMTTLKEYAPDAEQLEIETAAFELFEDPDEGWGWRLVDDIGETIARGSRRYQSRDDAHEDMDALRNEVGGIEARIMEHGIFQVYHDSSDEWWWRFVRPGGSTLAEAPSSFGTRHEAEDAIESMLDQYVEADLTVVGRLAILIDDVGEQWAWKLVNHDRTPIAESSRFFESQEATDKAIGRIRDAAGSITVFEIRTASFFVTNGDGWQWVLHDASHDTVAVGPSSYEDVEAAESAVDTVSDRTRDASYIEFDQAAFEIRETEDGWQWQLIDEDRAVIAASTQTYAQRRTVEDTIEEIRGQLANASILEIERAAFEFHEDDRGWRWRLIDKSGNELAESVKAYESRTEARNAMTTVKTYAPDAWTSVAN